MVLCVGEGSLVWYVGVAGVFFRGWREKKIGEAGRVVE